MNGHRAQSDKPIILVVEDDPFVRMSAVDYLRQTGLDTLEAGDALEAIGVLSEANARVGVVFSDINMPGEMDGCELASHIARHWPNLRVILTSGALQTRPLNHAWRFVAKPYDIEGVARLIEEALQVSD